MAKKLRVITNSLRTCYQECNRMAYFRYILERVATSDHEALVLGCGIHDWLDAWWTAKPDPKSAFSDPYVQAKYNAMTRGYLFRWSEWYLASVKSVQSEVEHIVPLINPDTGAPSTYWCVGVKLDKLAVIDGGLYIVEHKTSRDTSNGYFERLRMDSQISTYDAVVRQLKLERPLAGVLYDVLRKTQLKPLLATPIESRKYTKDGRLHATQRDSDETPEQYEARCLSAAGEAPEEYYQHYTVVRLENEVKEAARNLWFVSASIRESINSNRWPQNPKSCRSEFGYFCDYWPVCSGRASINDSTLYEYRRAHSELSKELLRDYQ